MNQTKPNDFYNNVRVAMALCSKYCIFEKAASICMCDAHGLIGGQVYFAQMHNKHRLTGECVQLR